MKILLSGVALLCTLGASAGIPPTEFMRYSEVLQRFVDDDGLVDYAGVKGESTFANFGSVNQVVGTPFWDATKKSWMWGSESERMAFWLNSYNAITLKLIVDNYPIQPSEGRTKYPANSIRQVPGSWEHEKFEALGRDVTLDEIEHKILRAEFKDPRIHMALVNSAVSAPKLRREPYIGTQLGTQLDDQARQFFHDMRKFHIDREAGEVWVSPIFNWFMDDFLPEASKNYPRHIAQQKALTAFASKYVSAEDAKYLQEGKYVVMYFEYDWTLNEQAK